jgi:hypothetical protein
MAVKKIYMLDPYRDVIQVTATQDSVFRLNLNNSIVYTQAEIWNKINSVALLNEDEDDLTRMCRWFGSQFSNTGDLRKAVINVRNLIQNNNSYSRHICGGISHVIISFLNHYDTSKIDFIHGGDVNGSHQWNCGDGFAFDQINKIPFYKGKYEIASFEELEADKYIYIEPLRKIFDYHYSQINYTSYITNSDRADGSTYPFSTIDDVYIRIPSGSSFVFPVKSSNTPQTEYGTNLEVWANLILTIPAGVTGVVEMPFNLLSVTGTGSVIVDEVTYDLPDDEAALLAACQTTEYVDEKWLHGFNITANTEGLEAEFLVNLHRVMLYEENTIEYLITSGGITIERVKTDKPIPIFPVSIDKGDNASFTLMYDKYLTKNKSIPLPYQGQIWDWKIIYFLPSSGKFSQPQLVQAIINSTQAFPVSINSGITYTDQCWAAKLMPRQESFSDSLELSFTAVDDSDTYYTTDGTTPDATKTKYTEAFIISATTTVKWINIKEGYADSHVNTRVITKT